MSARNVIALVAAGASMAFSLLTFLLAFLILPIYLFPLLAFFCGGVAFIAVESPRKGRKVAFRAFASLLMAAAVGTGIFWLRVMSAQTWH